MADSGWQDNEFDDDELNDFKSKSQVKRELQAVRALAKTLLSLPDKDLDKLPLDDVFRDAITKAQSMTQGALKRELGYVTKLLAQTDVEQVETAMEKLKQRHQGEVAAFHQIEQWRDNLLADDGEQLSQLYQQFPELDGQYVRQLVRNAKKEAQQSKPPKSARLLFQYLKTLSTDEK